jgi:hypothetical protein
MPIADWNVPMTLVTPQGELDLNDVGNAAGGFMLDNQNCKSGPAVRATADNVPQGDGAILHAGFLGGYALTLAIQYWAGDSTAACATSSPTSDTMNDELMRHLASIIDGGGRLLYTPAGKARRLLDRLQLFGDSIDVTETPGATGISFTLLSELPYSFDFEQQLTTIDDGTPTATLTNEGSIKYFPVFQIHGPFSAFILTNHSALDKDGNPLQIVYDADLPGAVPIGPSDYIEIITFENTCYLNGDGPSRKAGIDITTSDFWPLVVGDNDVEIEGEGTGPTPTVDILWQSAWL